MIKVFIIHGFRGSPNGGWRPWLMGELEKKDIYACALPMPTPDQPICSEWVEEISRNVSRNKNDEIYLVGHSLGVPAILHYLEVAASDIVISKVVLVSGPYTAVRPEIADFFIAPFDFKLIKSKAKEFIIIHGDNDPNVPFEQAEYLSEKLGAKLTAIPKGSHLNGSSGWTQLPECLEALL